MNEDVKWTFFPFIFLSKIYIKFYRGKKDFWIIFPSLILSLIVSLNIYVFLNLKYDINIYWIIGLYFLLYFVFFFIFHRRFPDYELVEKIKLTKTEKTITLITILSAIAMSFIILNILRSQNI
ncbi:hypothetical protein DNG35_05640 [Mesonia sp. K7]|nr:hypothetical protein DNG35_05640 [Mesonia sp. K7]